MDNRRSNLLCFKSAHSKPPILLCIKCRQHDIRCTLHSFHSRSTSWAPWIFLQCNYCSPDIISAGIGNFTCRICSVWQILSYPAWDRSCQTGWHIVYANPYYIAYVAYVFVMKTTMGVVTTTIIIEVCIWFMHMHINNKNPLFAPLQAPPENQNKDFYELYSYTWIWSWKV